ncbi:MAG: 1-(5-phosphoribosyl)-5-[(5-phosphoribosylamino)methylideneamino]imidazole-4-carboxamide isomerase [Armatimonadota bacterium]|nr:1-(5-phosphoribosyl)-5-[(5-phosphoribosylamino)methylideneamino]imidazole-4-carboxamide isomerase [Armatimonadota bacterium]
MEIIPAIDIKEGRCVRLLQGKFDQETVYSNDPVEMAKRWESEGAPRIHVVDLDGARSGVPQNLAIVEKIAANVHIPLQLGGGIRNLSVAKSALEVGVQRVIIGTSAALDTALAEDMFGALGEQAILGVDAKDGYVAVKGWEQTTTEKAIDFAKRMTGLGARRIIYTDISRDGMLQGVNLQAMADMTNAVTVPVIASGGVTNVKDIRDLMSLSLPRLEGVIIGKALYSGSITLADALAAANPL